MRVSACEISYPTNTTANTDTRASREMNWRTTTLAVYSVKSERNPRIGKHKSGRVQYWMTSPTHGGNRARAFRVALLCETWRQSGNITGAQARKPGWHFLRGRLYGMRSFAALLEALPRPNTNPAVQQVEELRGGKGGDQSIPQYRGRRPSGVYS